METRQGPPDEAPQSTEPTTNPIPDSATNPTTEAATNAPRLGGGIRARVWPVPLLAAAAWFVGLLPWLARRGSTGPFGTPWNPRNDLRTALLPFHQAQLTVLLVVTLMAGVLAGATAVWGRRRPPRRLLMIGCTALGAAVAAGWAVAQTLSPDPDIGGSGQTATRVRLALVALTAVAVLSGLVLGWLLSLGGPAVRAVAAAPVAVVGADWLGLLVVGVGGAPGPAWLSTALAIATGLVTAACLVATVSSHVAARVVAWVSALALLVVTPSALVAGRYVLEAAPGTSVRPSAVAELLTDGLQVFRGSLSVTLGAWGPPPAPPLLALLVAAVVGLAVSVLLGRAPAARRRPAG